MSIRFDDRVAIVTGSGRGLGRSHALELAKRGARVIVNELADAADGSSVAADEVAGEINAAGGKAIAYAANVADFEEVQSMVRAARDAWGRVDILINNAGNLRDKSFGKMSIDDFRSVIEVHAMGAANCSKAVWSLMRDQEYGRIVLTSSISGLYGNFGQSNYATAKAAMLGLMNVLSVEGEKYDIRVNCIVPSADTRMMKPFVSKAEADALPPDAVSAGVVFLVSDDAPNQTMLRAAGGFFSIIRLYETVGIVLPREVVCAENVAKNWDAICNLQNVVTFDTISESADYVWCILEDSTDSHRGTW